MPKEYICELCKKSFGQKVDYQRHKAKKAPCIGIEDIKQLVKTSDNTSNLTNVFKYCLDVLRDNEHLTGDKALRTLAHLLSLRLIEPQLNKINIDEYDYVFEEVEDEDKAKLLSFARFSNIAKQKEDNIPKIMKLVWNEILSQHPKTKQIFIKGKGFDINNQSTYVRLIKKLSEFDFESIEADIQGEAYEEVIKDIMTGKVLGQFFTPPNVKKMMVDLVNPKIFKDGKIETIFDPAMGTGGFLITSLRHIIKEAKLKDIKINWEFVSSKGLGGREAEPDTYQLARANMLISSGYMFDVLECGDSIRNPITTQYDIILANPPFGIKGLNYDDIQHELKNKYLPIKSNSAVPLFLQAIIYMLKINGRCAIVLPDGQELFSKNNALVSVREYLMKTCKLKEVIYLPSGVFTHTSIKTCVFYFVKKKECQDVLETKISYSTKTQKENKRSYKFTKTHQTKNVKFYDYNPYNGVKNLLIKVPMDELAKNQYSLNYAEYKKEEKIEYDNTIEIKTLGDICKFLPKSKRSASFGQTQGIFPFFKSSMNVSSFVDNPDYNDESIIIGDGGEPNINYGLKFSTSDHCYVLQPNNYDGLLKYVYYYLVHKLDTLAHLYTGVAIKNISKNSISLIEIPIPSLERQQDIAKQLDFIYDNCIKMDEIKIEQLQKLNEMCLNRQIKFGKNDIKCISDICIINPDTMKNGTYTEINYVDIGSVSKGMLHDAKHLQNDFPSRAKRIIKQGDILYSSVRPNLQGYLFIDKDIPNGIASTGFAQIRTTNVNVLPKYVYHMITLQYITDILVSKSTGAQYPSVPFAEFGNLEIHVPSLDTQKQIVEYCDKNNELIKSLEDNIERSKQMAKQIIADINTQNDD